MERIFTSHELCNKTHHGVLLCNDWGCYNDVSFLWAESSSFRFTTFFLTTCTSIEFSVNSPRSIAFAFLTLKQKLSRTQLAPSEVHVLRETLPKESSKSVQSDSWSEINGLLLIHRG